MAQQEGEAWKCNRYLEQDKRGMLRQEMGRKEREKGKQEVGKEKSGGEERYKDA